MKLPKGKSENIIVNTFKDEVLIYDLLTNQASCLNLTSANVFNGCDGKTTFAELKAKYNYSDEIIYLALDGLKKESLLEDEYVSPFAGMNRREVIRKVGLASMIMLPVISSLIAPAAVMAASGCVNPGGSMAGTATGATCSGTQATCNSFCSGQNTGCCSNIATAAPGCSPVTPCNCVCS